jgi:hypothetical protein
MACGRCNEALLISRENFCSDATVCGVLASFGAWFLREEIVSEWPGTELVGGQVALSTCYRFDEDFAKKFVSLNNRLFKWLHPSFPEDLCLFRNDGTPWLVSIAHERDAFVNLSEEEEIIFFNDPLLCHLIGSRA